MILSTKTLRILSLKFCLTLNTTAVEHANLQFLTAMGPIRVFATSDHHSFFVVKCGESTLFSFFSIDPQHGIFSFLFYFNSQQLSEALPFASSRRRAGPLAGRPSRCTLGKPRCHEHHEPRYESLRSDQTLLGFGSADAGSDAGSASGSASGCSDPRPPGCRPQPGGVPGVFQVQAFVLLVVLAKKSPKRRSNTNSNVFVQEENHSDGMVG